MDKKNKTKINDEELAKLTANLVAFYKLVESTQELEEHYHVQLLRIIRTEFPDLDEEAAFRSCICQNEVSTDRAYKTALTNYFDYPSAKKADDNTSSEK